MCSLDNPSFTACKRSDVTFTFKHEAPRMLVHTSGQHDDLRIVRHGRHPVGQVHIRLLNTFNATQSTLDALRVLNAPHLLDGEPKLHHRYLSLIPEL